MEQRARPLTRSLRNPGSRQATTPPRIACNCASSKRYCTPSRLQASVLHAGPLDPPARWRKCRGITRNSRTHAMTDATNGGRKIIWMHVLTVVSAAILIGAEVFGAAFAGGWAVANMFSLGSEGVLILQAAFFLLGVYVMIQFLRGAQVIEPFTARE